MKYEVTFPHTAPDGSKRAPGDVVDLDEQEARTRLDDGFIREHRPRRSKTDDTTKPAQKS